MIKWIKKIIEKNYIWIIFLIVTMIFISIAEDVFEREIFEFDGIIYNFFVQNRNLAFNAFFKNITNLGSAIAIISITIICIIFIKNKKYKIAIPVNLAIITTLNIIFKNIFVRDRPNELRLIDETGYSFPSGHAMVSTAFYGLLIYIVYKNIKNKKTRNIICGLLVLLVLCIDISRIYVGVHYVSDVIAGTCFSIAYLILLTRLIEEKKTDI